MVTSSRRKPPPNSPTMKPPSSLSPSRKPRSRLPAATAGLLLLALTTLFLLHAADLRSSFSSSSSSDLPPSSTPPRPLLNAVIADQDHRDIITTNNTINSNENENTDHDLCDVYDGKWVYDDDEREQEEQEEQEGRGRGRGRRRNPIYKEAECGFLTEQVTCMRTAAGTTPSRSGAGSPAAATSPVGVHGVLAPVGRTVGQKNPGQKWLAQCVHTPGVQRDGGVLLGAVPGGVELGRSDDPQHPEPDHHATSIAKHAANWKGDYLIFNTYIWWMNTPRMKVLRGSFDKGSTKYDEIDRPVAYRRVLKTWARWVEKNVDLRKTMVFFMSSSPIHIKSAGWGNPNGIKCAMETTPVANGRSR
uniref:Trichome birefringence-like C-terminal domain-containing protein n=1 Tax=Ananas comosus var. bracteatus TaxID=296719 RepID=A0A6V7Q9F0_ANACO|nr:unnamed protein product [Ananas comosus var. bracteatus]